MGNELQQRLIDLFQWFDPDPDGTHLVSDHSGWWRDPVVLAGLGPALVRPFRAQRPTVVVAPALTGLIIGPLAATALGVGFVPAYKPDERHLPGPVSWAQGPADYRERNVRLGVLDRHLAPGDRVLVVDDWVATGAQLRAIYTICAARGAEPLGTAAVVDACPPEVSRKLRIRALLDAARLG